MTTTILNITSFTDRKAQLGRDLEVAEQVYSEAALANAVGTGSDKDMDRAKAVLARAKDKIAALDAAWQEAQKRHLATTRDKQCEIYSKFLGEFDGLLKQRENAGQTALDAAVAMSRAMQAFNAVTQEIRELAGRAESETRVRRLVEGINLALQPAWNLGDIAASAADRGGIRTSPVTGDDTVFVAGRDARAQLKRSTENIRGQAVLHAPEALKENA